MINNNACIDSSSFCSNNTVHHGDHENLDQHSQKPAPYLQSLNRELGALRPVNFKDSVPTSHYLGHSLSPFNQMKETQRHTQPHLSKSMSNESTAIDSDPLFLVMVGLLRMGTQDTTTRAQGLLNMLIHQYTTTAEFIKKEILNEIIDESPALQQYIQCHIRDWT